MKTQKDCTAGVENHVTEGVVMSMKVATEAACPRIARWAFRYAVRRKRKKVTAIHKANIMKFDRRPVPSLRPTSHEEEFPQHAEYQRS